MGYLVLALLATLLLETLSCFVLSGSSQKRLAALTILIITFDSIYIFGLRPAAWSLLLIYFSAFRVLNLFKLIRGQKQIDYLRSSFLRTSLFLVFFQLVIVWITHYSEVWSWSSRALWEMVIWLQFIGIVIVALSLRRALSKTKPKLGQVPAETLVLPTVTVAIPARNETEDLEKCLESLVASDYPKLEILVLDDCSQEKRTPEIIRQFAQAGVRFLAGKQPDDSWTAKNFAYHQLNRAANGQLILFVGVDVRFEPQTIRHMVELLLVKHKTMVSFMPLNNLPPERFRRLLIQPLRYLWELGLPRRFVRRPPVLSTCWMIDRSVLQAGGGFAAVSRSITPERYFARQTAGEDDGYSFVCLGRSLGLSCDKSFIEQRSTAIRTRYPQLKQRPENLSAVALIEISLFVAPLVLFFYPVSIGSYIMSGVSSATLVISALIMFSITRQTYNANLLLSLVVFPLAYAYDVILSVISMWRYEFSEVIWKDRNVCIPVMQQEAVLKPVK